MELSFNMHKISSQDSDKNIVIKKHINIPPMFTLGVIVGIIVGLKIFYTINKKNTDNVQKINTDTTQPSIAQKKQREEALKGMQELYRLYINTIRTSSTLIKNLAQYQEIVRDELFQQTTWDEIAKSMEHVPLSVALIPWIETVKTNKPPIKIENIHIKIMQYNKTPEEYKTIISACIHQLSLDQSLVKNENPQILHLKLFIEYILSKNIAIQMQKKQSDDVFNNPQYKERAKDIKRLHTIYMEMITLIIEKKNSEDYIQKELMLDKHFNITECKKTLDENQKRAKDPEFQINTWNDIKKHIDEIPLTISVKFAPWMRIGNDSKISHFSGFYVPKKEHDSAKQSLHKMLPDTIDQIKNYKLNDNKGNVPQSMNLLTLMALIVLKNLNEW